VTTEQSSRRPVTMRRGVPGSLVRYRVMAYITGVMLLLLCFVAIPIQIWGHNDGPVSVIGTAHGFLYCVYLLAAFDLALRARWSALGTVFVLLAGTIPFLSFVAERIVTRRTRAGERV
jgi:integral membrane protein